MASLERKTKAELIQELNELQERLAADTAAHQLAVVQEIEKALSNERDMDAIYDAVATKVSEIFDAQFIGFYEVDLPNELMYFPWGNESGMTEKPESVPLNSLYRHFMQQGGTVLINEGFEKFASQFDDYQVPYGLAPKSVVSVPVIQQSERQVIISLQDMEHEQAFSQEDVKLLEALAATMGTALENARLFDEIQQRNAELAIVNSVSEAMTKDLDVESVVKIVGDKVQQIFSADMVAIGFVNEEKDVTEVPYSYALGKHFEESSFPLGEGLAGIIFKTRKPLLLNKREEILELGSVETEADRDTKDEIESWLGVPIIIGDKLIGGVSVQSYLKNAFDDRDLRLLSTLAANMGAVIENARLFEETQARNAELAIINTVQEGLAAELDMQGIYQLVGDKISEITKANVVLISSWDWDTEIVHINYGWNYGEHLEAFDRPFTQLHHETFPVLEQGKTLVWNENVHEIYERTSHVVAAGEIPKTIIAVPLRIGGKIRAFISIQDFKQEFAFDQETIRLVETLTGNMEIALENARLFEETQARNAELAVINSVQEGLAAELDIQGIYQLVGNKVSEITGANVAVIGTMKWEEDTFRADYFRDGDQILHGLERPVSAFHRSFREEMEAGSTLVLNQGIEEIYKQHGHVIAAGKMPKTMVSVPMRVGGEFTAFISLQDTEREFAFDKATIRLVETLAGNMEIALENARLFDELQSRNAEISAALERQTATSDILHIIANSPGEIQPVLDAVAAHAAKLCEADDVQIYHVEEEKLVQVSHFGPLPALKNGESLPLDPGLATGKAVLERRTFQMDAGDMSESEFPISVKLQKRLKHRSVIMTPLVREGKSIGAIVARRNEVREFSEIQENLLRTFADQAAIAIENVRLFEETRRLLSESRQQAEELKTVNTVSQALSAEIEMDALIEMIGNQVQNIFSADIAYLALLDSETHIIEFPYMYGETIQPLKLGEGLTSRVIQEGEPLLINQDAEWQKTKKRIGVKSKSYLGVPIHAGKDVIGAISVQSTGWSNLFNEEDVRLLSTIAANVGAAISNANLFSEVERQKVYLEALISSAPVAIVTIDLNGDVSGWSPAAEELYGYTADEAIGRNVDDLVANNPEIREEAEKYTSHYIENIGALQLKTQRTHKDGQLIDVAISAMPVYIEGELKGYIAIYNDISQLERARRDAEEANQAKSAFLANMSHELRTPLNAIIGFSRIVKRKGQDVLPEKQVDNLDKVLVSAEHLLGLINTVLDISKIEAGRMDIHLSNFEIKPLIDLLMVTVKPLVREDAVKLVVEVDDGLPMIRSDLEKVKQILLNLLSNAAKFTHEGEIKVVVRQAGSQMHVDVSDSGIGIVPESLDSIFEEFQQADVSTTREYGGTGLGLSISRSLAQLLGGDLRVVSEPGVGSTFTLSIPVDHSHTPMDEDQEVISEQAEGDQLVLVIDDNPDAIYLVRENLEHAGYQVAVAKNGEDGLRMAQELRPFAITLDIMMPEKDGWQVLYDLKLNPETQGIPVIMISIVDKKALGFRLGAADYLIKPLDEEQVLDSLEKLKKRSGDRPVKRLLVVDDDPNIPDMIRQLLEDRNYKVAAAFDGQEAWEMIQAKRPDAVLLDLMMPRMDGFGLIDKLKGDEKYAELPVIVLTAKLLSEKERDALNDSVGRVIQKQGLSGEALLDEISHSIRETI